MRKLFVGLVAGAALIGSPGLAPAEAVLPAPRLRFLAVAQVSPSDPTTSRTNMLYQAQLHDVGTPIVGRTIRFVVGAAQVCSAVTDSQGWARCQPSGPPEATTPTPTVSRAIFDGDSEWRATHRDQTFYENVDD